MKRKIYLGSLAFSFLLLATSLFAAPVEAVEEQEYEAKFHYNVVGNCIVAPNYAGGNLPPEWFIGRGVVALTGFGEVDQYPPVQNIPEIFYFRDSGIHATGSFSLRWESSKLQVVLYSRGEAGGLFVDEGIFTDSFALGFGQGVGLVLYKGTYWDDTGIHQIEGKAAVSVLPAPGSTIKMTSVILLHSDYSPFLGALWFDAAAEVFGLRAPNYFASSVKIDVIP